AAAQDTAGSNVAEPWYAKAQVTFTACGSRAYRELALSDGQRADRCVDRRGRQDRAPVGSGMQQTAARPGANHWRRSVRGRAARLDRKRRQKYLRGISRQATIAPDRPQRA